MKEQARSGGRECVDGMGMEDRVREGKGSEERKSVREWGLSISLRRGEWAICRKG
ncbi:hypothetical protein BM1374166_01848 [Bartonella tribocorum]|nr:hypothetical protein BM1374166_01848 [Bartonella tribocorum]